MPSQTQLILAILSIPIGFLKLILAYVTMKKKLKSYQICHRLHRHQPDGNPGFTWPHTSMATKPELLLDPSLPQAMTRAIILTFYCFLVFFRNYKEINSGQVKNHILLPPKGYGICLNSFPVTSKCLQQARV